MGYHYAFQRLFFRAITAVEVFQEKWRQNCHGSLASSCFCPPLWRKHNLRFSKSHSTNWNPFSGFSPKQLSVLCFWISRYPVPRDLQDNNAYTHEKKLNNIWNTNSPKQTSNYERSKELFPTMPRLCLLIIYGNFMRVGIVNGQINFL